MFAELGQRILILFFRSLGRSCVEQRKIQYGGFPSILCACLLCRKSNIGSFLASAITSVKSNSVSFAAGEIRVCVFRRRRKTRDPLVLCNVVKAKVSRRRNRRFTGSNQQLDSENVLRIPFQIHYHRRHR